MQCGSAAPLTFASSFMERRLSLVMSQTCRDNLRDIHTTNTHTLTHTDSHFSVCLFLSSWPSSRRRIQTCKHFHLLGIRVERKWQLNLSWCSSTPRRLRCPFEPRQRQRRRSLLFLWFPLCVASRQTSSGSRRNQNQTDRFDKRWYLSPFLSVCCKPPHLLCFPNPVPLVGGPRQPPVAG